MKRVISTSLGSSRRDKTVVTDFFGEPVQIERIGTDGDTARFRRLLLELDASGGADAIGLGGLDRYLWENGRRYELRSTRELVRGIRTPLTDGSGLKNTLERETVRWLAAQKAVDFAHQKTLMVCGVDRFGMSEALAEQGGELVFGDLMFSLGVPYAIRSAGEHCRLARVLLPILTQLPITLLYPTGEKQNAITPRWGEFYRDADIIAGDYLLIHRYLPAITPDNPQPLAGKTILTNTTTPADVDLLQKRGVRWLITTTPCFEKRTFGTNVIEAAILAVRGGTPPEETAYLDMLRAWNWTPTVRDLNPVCTG